MRLGKSFIRGLLVVAGAVATIAMVMSVFYEPHFGGEGPFLVARFSLKDMIADLPRHLPWWAAFCLLTSLMIPARAIQWQRTLNRPIPFSERYHLVAIGAFVHNALPGKLGDIARAFLLGRTQKLSFVETLGSVAVCKLLEFAALMLFLGAAFFGPFASHMQAFGPATKVAAVFCLALVIAVVFLARYSGAGASWMSQRGLLPKLQPHLRNISQGLGAARSAREFLGAFALSIPPVLLNVSAYSLGLEGVGIAGGFSAGAVVLGAIALGQVAIGLPAGTGIYYFVTSWSARALGASPADAASFATLTHLGTILTQLSVGAMSVWLRKIRWSDLRLNLRRKGWQKPEEV